MPHVEDVIFHGALGVVGLGREDMGVNAQQALDLGMVVRQGEITRELGLDHPSRQGDLDGGAAVSCGCIGVGRVGLIHRCLLVRDLVGW